MLAVVKLGAGVGWVTSIPAGIDCGPACSAAFATGVVVTLTAVPDHNSVFGGWSGVCSGTSPTCTVEVEGETSVSAAFVDMSEHVLEVATAGDGHGEIVSTPSGIVCESVCEAAFPAGRTVILNATPAAGHAFAGWSGDCSGSSVTCSIVMDGDRAAVATFVVIPLPPPGKVSLAVVRSGEGSGSVLSNPSGIVCGSTCTAEFDEGADASLSATPESGSVFAGWSGACGGASPRCEVNLADDTTVGAMFGPEVPKHDVIVTITGEGSVASEPVGVACPGTCIMAFEEGTSVVLSATPADGWQLAEWRDGCTGQVCGFQVREDVEIRAVFEEIPAVQYRFDVTIDGQGAVTSSPAGIDCPTDCSAIFDAEDFVVLESRAAVGWSFIEWTGDCTGQMCALELTGDSDVTAVFRAQAIEVTTSSGGRGGPECTLRDAISSANRDSAVGGCPAGHGADTIELPSDATIELTEVELESQDEFSNNFGLPEITTDIHIQGNGSIIQRRFTDGTPSFSFFLVSPQASLTLQGLSLQGGGSEPGCVGDQYIYAGAIQNYGDLVLDHARLVHNDASCVWPGFYGALFNAGSTQISDSTFEGNLGEGAVLGNADGGTVEIDRTTFERSYATNSEGIAIENGGVMEVRNSTIAGSAVDDIGYVVGALAGSRLLLEHVTIAHNSAQALGVWDDAANPASVTLRAVLLTDNRDPYLGLDRGCVGPVTSLGYNVTSDASCALSAVGDLMNANIKLRSLGAYGGPTRTMAPSTDPAQHDALDTIPPSSCTLQVDQRGFDRPLGEGCDPGSVEVMAEE